MSITQQRDNTSISINIIRFLYQLSIGNELRLSGSDSLHNISNLKYGKHLIKLCQNYAFIKGLYTLSPTSKKNYIRF